MTKAAHCASRLGLGPPKSLAYNAKGWLAEFATIESASRTKLIGQFATPTRKNSIPVLSPQFAYSAKDVTCAHQASRHVTGYRREPLRTQSVAGEPATGGALVIPFEIQKPGYVSAVICDGQGKLVRELMHAVPRSAGRQFMVWDGLDRDGNSLPAGEYTWKLLQSPGLKATYLMSVGSSFPPGMDWSTACGPGTHVSPFGVAVDETGIYVAANTTENIETCLLKLTPDGKSRLWSALHPRAWDGALSLAVDGGELFMLGHVTASDSRIEPDKKRKQLVYVYDAATGQLARRTQTGSAVGDIPVMIDVQWDPADENQDASDMDAHDGVLVVAYEKRNALRWL